MESKESTVNLKESKETKVTDGNTHSLQNGEQRRNEDIRKELAKHTPWNKIAKKYHASTKTIAKISRGDDLTPFKERPSNKEISDGELQRKHSHALSKARPNSNRDRIKCFCGTSGEAYMNSGRR